MQHLPFHAPASRRQIALAVLWITTAFATAACGQLPPLPVVGDADLTPPSIVGIELRNPVELIVRFDEPVAHASDGVGASDAIEGVVLEIEDDRVGVFRFAAAPAPEIEHWVEAQVADRAGNNLRFLLRFHGLNRLLPAMVINEFTTKGSTNRPDMVEIAVLTDGNIAGATLFEGLPGDWDQRFVFPSVDVEAGDFIVVHFRPDGIPEEINETVSKSQSGGKDATDTAWDYWVPGGTGLSSNNGVLTLTENPLGGYIDAVIYTNRTSASDDRYRGFGSTKLLNRVDAITAAGHWVYVGAMVAPEDAVNSERSTATRSMARSSDSRDTNSKDDWHITPTSGVSPGRPNTDERFE